MFSGPGLELDGVLAKDLSNVVNISEDSSDESQAVILSETKVAKMPEYLLVCCWRSIKEVSLLLAQIIKDSPVIEEHQSGLISVEQVWNTISYVLHELLEICF